MVAIFSKSVDLWLKTQKKLLAFCAESANVENSLLLSSRPKLMENMSVAFLYFSLYVTAGLYVAP